MRKQTNNAKYKWAKKEAKKEVTLSKSKAFEKLYQRLQTKDGETVVLKLVRATKNKKKGP